jgi:PAS domain S-box-containing protein
MRVGSSTKRSLRIAFIYAAMAAAWVLFSDRAAAALATDAAMLVRLSMLKGWLFVAITAALLFFLCRRQLEATALAASASDKADAARLLAETQQALAREAASSASIRLSVAALGAHLGTWEWDMVGGRVLFDERMHEIYGIPPGAFAGTTDAWLQLLHPDDRDHVRRLHSSIATGQREFHTQFRILRADGQVRHVEIHAQVLRDRAGRPLRVSGINIDITERVVAEQRYRFLADNISDVLWVVDADTGCYTYVSPSIVRLRGCPPEALVGKSIEYGLCPAAVALIRERMPVLLKAFLSGDSSVTTQTHEIEQIRVDGSTVWTEVATTFIRNDHGGVEIIGVSRDISARHAAEQAFRTSAVRLAHAEAIAGIGHWTLHIETSQIEGSDNAARLCGLTPGGRWPLAQIRDLILPEYRERVMVTLRAAVEDGKPYDTVYRQRRADDGAIVTIHARGERDAAQRIVFGTIQDITAQRRAEEQLRLRSAALEASALSIAITDADGCIEWVNPAFIASTGYRLEEALGAPLNQLARSDRHSDEFYLQIQSTVAAGNTWHGEMFERRKDGTQIPVEQTVTPVRDDEGRVAHFIVIGQDVSERQRLQEQVLRSQRLDSIGRLAGGIAHDLNNILSPILMAPSILRETVSDPGAREVLDTVEASANRGAAIIRQLLTFSRGGTGGKHLPVQLLDVVHEMVVMIRETFPKNILTRTELQGIPWLVEGDATQLHQVLMNLCVNARDAMPEGGILTLTVENVELDAAAVAGHADAAPGPYVMLGVCDTGCGIAPEHLNKIFDPFFTTKAVGKGTGLGLATALGLVRAHGGFFQIRSNSGAGTQARVYLPALLDAPRPASVAEPEVPPRGQGELILVVDDEENVRRVTTRILERHGYRVVTAGDGAEAFSRFQEHRTSIRLVITDLLMPIMDGATLTRTIRRLDPTARVIAVSGRTPDDEPLKVGTDVVALLSKPYERVSLLRAVAVALPVPVAGDGI